MESLSKNSFYSQINRLPPDLRVQKYEPHTTWQNFYATFFEKIFKDSYYKRKKKHDSFHRRAAIEPTIGHIKSDHRMSHNYLKGVVGDAVNLMLSAAAFNFKRAMNSFFDFFLKWMERMCKRLSLPKTVFIDVHTISMRAF